MADKANGVQRWEVDFSVGYEGSHAAAWMAKADDGEYVSYADYEQLQAKLEAAERDAVRWHYIRNRHDDRSDTLCVTVDDGMIEDAYLSDAERIDLQSAIDAAIDAQRQEGKHG